MNDSGQPRPHGWQLRRLGLLLFLVTAVLPVYSCRAHPSEFEARPGRPLVRWSAGSRSRSSDVPVREIAAHFESGWESNRFYGPIWFARKWYPYLLGPIWVAALIGASRVGARGRRRIAAALLGLSGGLIVFEGFYLSSDYSPPQPVFGKGEWIAIWFLVAAALLWRPRRRDDPVGAAISAQALLCFFHALSFPLTDVIDWGAKGYGFAAISKVIAACYLPAFWLAVWALFLTALPGYLRRPHATKTV